MLIRAHEPGSLVIVGICSSDDSLCTRALAYAAFHVHEDIVRLLLDAQAQIHGQVGPSSDAALHWAAARGQEHVLRVLLEAKADKTLVDGNDRTAFHVACEEGQLDMVRFLLEISAGDDIAASDCTLGLGHATYNGWTSIVQLLSEFGARVNDQVGEGSRTALHWATLGGQAFAVRCLLQARADRHLTDTEGRTSLRLACWGICALACLRTCMWTKWLVETASPVEKPNVCLLHFLPPGLPPR